MGQWWIDNPQRALSNNSVAYQEKPEIEMFIREWLSLLESKSGERGIFNRPGIEKKMLSTGRRKIDGHIIGTNPCLTGDTMVGVLLNGKFTNITIKKLCNTQHKYDHIKILSRSEEKISFFPVSKIELTKKNADVLMIVDNNKEFLKCTPEHKIMTQRGWIPAQDLIEDDELVYSFNNVKKKKLKIEYLSSKEDVYDITVPETHCFFANSILVHNCR